MRNGRQQYIRKEVGKNSKSWELMKRWQNKTTPLRRRTIKEHWKKISSDPRDNPRQFFGTFVTSKGKNDKVDISLDIQGKVQQDQQLVAVEFTNYFSTVADNIEGSKSG